MGVGGGHWEKVNVAISERRSKVEKPGRRCSQLGIRGLRNTRVQPHEKEGKI